MNIYVAGGATGFLGQNIANVLEKRGDVVTRSCKSKRDWSIDCGYNLAGCDVVFHCAAHTSGAKEMLEHPEAQVFENLDMNMNLLRAAQATGVKKFVFISSSAVYPESTYKLKEDDAFLGDPPKVYFGPAWMKRYTEKLLEFYHRQYGMQVLVIRPSNVYGPRCNFDLERAHVIPALIRKFVEAKDEVEVWGRSDVMRDFIFVDDFVEGVLRAFDATSGFDVYNIASGLQYSIGEVATTLALITGFDGQIVYNESKPMTVNSRRIDTTRAVRNLGFIATTPLHVGLKRTFEWYIQSLKK